MRALSYIILLSLLYLSCGKKETLEGLAPEISAKEIIQNSLEKYNTEAFYNTTISFKLEDLHYNLYRKNNISNFEVTRYDGDSIYKATYSNGYIEYSLNGQLQEDTSELRRFIGARLEGLVYLFSIPHVFNQNGVYFKKLEDVIIMKKHYYAIDVSFTKIEDTPVDRFILYIDPKTFLVKYFADDYHLVPGERLTFKAAHNFRTIHNIPFADYFILTPRMQKRATDPKPNTALEDIYKSYNKLDLDELRPMIFKDLKVDIN